MGDLISSYGYLAVSVACFFEGEIAVILGAFAAANEYLEMPGVIMAAFVGTVAADNLWFWLGRRLGRPFLLRRQSWRDKARRVERLCRRHGTVTILSMRFLYGLRTVTPFVLGAVRVHPLKFLLLEAASTVVWVLLVSWLVWPLVVAATSAADADGRQWFVIVVILGVAGLIWAGYFLYERLRGGDRLD